VAPQRVSGLSTARHHCRTYQRKSPWLDAMIKPSSNLTPENRKIAGDGFEKSSRRRDRQPGKAYNSRHPCRLIGVSYAELGSQLDAKPYAGAETPPLFVSSNNHREQITALLPANTPNVKSPNACQIKPRSRAGTRASLIASSPPERPILTHGLAPNRTQASAPSRRGSGPLS
jgi:hypothetical protein